MNIITAHVSTPRNNVFGVVLSMGDNGCFALFIECKNLKAAEKLRDEMNENGKNITIM